MAVRALDNTAFGFPASCYVCDPDNPAGLHLSFVHDDGKCFIGIHSASTFSFAFGWASRMCVRTQLAPRRQVLQVGLTITIRRGSPDAVSNALRN